MLYAQQEEPTFEIDEQIQRMYGTQDYLIAKGIVCTGSGTEFSMRRDICDHIREVEARVRELRGTIKIEKVDIGFVFHILNSDDLEVSRNLIQHQINALNRDFNNRAWNKDHPNDPERTYLNRATSAKFNCFLAKLPQSSWGQGIAALRNANKKWDAWDDMKRENTGGSRGRDADYIINVWVTDLPYHLSSYATSPYEIDENDGIVIDASFFGNQPQNPNFSQGKTLTHLVANYLGLHDLWSEASPCQDDSVEDTPIHNAINYGQPLYGHHTTCIGQDHAPEMVMNYMDNTDDELQMMFTQGQVKRMHAIMQIARPTLFSQSSKSAGL